jgi:hypothetical protein
VSDNELVPALDRVAKHLGRFGNLRELLVDGPGLAGRTDGVAT